MEDRIINLSTIKSHLSDKYWRLNNLYKIINKNGVEQTFRFNWAQQIIWDKCFKNGQLIINPNILKARQLGITTFFAINYFDDCIWNRNINAYIQSHENDSIEKIFRIVRYAYEHLPYDCKPDLDRGGGSKYEYYFPSINSRIYVGLENRSSTIHRLHFSETAFQDKDRIAATMAALPPWICHSNETTPNGLNWYHDDYIAKKANRLDMFFPWFDHYEYKIDNIDTGELTQAEIEYNKKVNILYGKELTKPQIEFKRQKIADLKGENEFNKEYPSDDDSCFYTADTSRLIVPEASQSIMWIGSQTRPEYMDWYVVCDLALKDFFSALFCYLDFKINKLIFEYEYVTHYATTHDICENLKRIESELKITPYKRYADCNNSQQIFDLNHEENYHITRITKGKDNKETFLHAHQGYRDRVRTNARVAVSQGKILVNPVTCPVLCKCLSFGKWNENRTDYERTPELGHVDPLITMFYAIDNVEWDKNPYPLIDPRLEFPKTNEDKKVRHDTFVNPMILKQSQKRFDLLLGRKR